jgi:hypothetical protein
MHAWWMINTYNFQNDLKQKEELVSIAQFSVDLFNQKAFRTEAEHCRSDPFRSEAIGSDPTSLA